MWPMSGGNRNLCLPSACTTGFWLAWSKLLQKAAEMSNEQLRKTLIFQGFFQSKELKRLNAALGALTSAFIYHSTVIFHGQLFRYCYINSCWLFISTEASLLPSHAHLVSQSLCIWRLDSFMIKYLFMNYAISFIVCDWQPSLLLYFSLNRCTVLKV